MSLNLFTPTLDFTVFRSACYADLKPRMHQNSDLWLLLATFVIAACYAEQKPGVRILAAACNLRPQDPKTTPKKDPKPDPGPEGTPKRTPKEWYAECNIHII